jgi:hypothetical protein
MSHRLQVTVPDDVADELDRRGEIGGQPASRVAAQLILAGLGGGASRTSAPAPGQRLAAGRHVEPVRPPWLEPSDPVKARWWRSELWGSVLALRARYPRELGSLEARWWRKPARVEQLAALAAWRSQIDQDCLDPREEFIFQAQLADFQRVLEQTPGVGADVFQPGAPPPEWLEPRGTPQHR